MSKKPIYKSKNFRRYSTRFWWFTKLTKKDYNQIQYWQDTNKKQPKYYTTRLKTRRALAIFYGGLSYKQIHTLYLQAFALPGKPGPILFQSLEKRLDVSLFRASFAISMQAAKQLINHDKILVNRCVVTSPGFLLKPGDIVSTTITGFQWLCNQHKEKLEILSIKHPKSSHLEVMPEILTFIFLFSPEQVALPYFLQKRGKRIIKRPLFDNTTISQMCYPLKG
jgi:ribosomal protein S4